MLKNNIALELLKMQKSQNWLSNITGIAKGLISQIASGRSIPTPEELSLICGVMGCQREKLYSPDNLRLITGVEPKPKRKRDTKPVRITLPIIDQVDRFAHIQDISRDEAFRALILMGLSASGHAFQPRVILEGGIKHADTCDGRASLQEL